MNVADVVFEMKDFAQYNAISGAPTAEEIISPPAEPHRGRGYIIRGSNGQNASFYRRS